jgi:hypothetical protein
MASFLWEPAKVTSDDDHSSKQGPGATSEAARAEVNGDECRQYA